MPVNLVTMTEPTTKPACDRSQWKRREALLAVSESIAVHRDLPALFHDLALRLPGVVSFDFLNLVLHDPARKTMRLHILESRILHDALEGSERPIDGSPGGEATAQRPTPSGLSTAPSSAMPPINPAKLDRPSASTALATWISRGRSN